MVRLAPILACLAVLSIPQLAAADRVPGPPESCPPGSTPETGHGGPHCAPSPDCTGGAECQGRACTAIDQCIETRGCGGRRRPDPGTPDTCTIEHVAGPCGAGRA